jgi:hypothetical protein
VQIRYGLIERWGDLDLELRWELIAKARAEDTMKAWENHLLAQD